MFLCEIEIVMDEMYLRPLLAAYWQPTLPNWQLPQFPLEYCPQLPWNKDK